MRFFAEDKGKLYELVKSTIGCGGCEWNTAKSPSECRRKDECRSASRLLFGHLDSRHWREVRMG